MMRRGPDAAAASCNSWAPLTTHPIKKNQMLATSQCDCLFFSSGSIVTKIPEKNVWGRIYYIKFYKHLLNKGNESQINSGRNKSVTRCLSKNELFWWSNCDYEWHLVSSNWIESSGFNSINVHHQHLFCSCWDETQTWLCIKHQRFKHEFTTGLRTCHESNRKQPGPK